jgi:hypothetical protein
MPPIPDEYSATPAEERMCRLLKLLGAAIGLAVATYGLWMR